ncbi:hypothetical protein BDF21DRAFT_493979 [Thamnidium elegans]|nr:hypothetical protein BDF21DRAFT_493979 [Thamnidium elegans]
MENDEQLQTNSYVWSQTNDQVTISFLVPESAKSKDLDITIERRYLKAGLKGEEPVFMAKLFQDINHFDSLWQLEKNNMSPFSSLTASPNLSIASSYAFMSPNHSPNSSMILPQAADTTGMSEMSDLLTGANSSDDMSSQPNSPTLLHTPPSIATPPHMKKPKYRILTIHLEKEEILDWAVPVSGPHHKDEVMDITSCYLLGQWFESRMGNLIKALEYFISAAERGHTQSMIKAAVIYETNKETTTATKVPEKDSKKAFEWYKRAADCAEQESGKNLTNGPDPLACYIVGTTYGSGSEEADIKKDYQNALVYFNRCMTITAPRIDIDFSLLDTDDILPKSKLRNHPPHTRDERYFCSSAFQTGLIYLYGSHPEGETVHSCTTVEVDADLAIRYWKEAAMLGHAQACFNIGILYANGMGVEHDLWVAGKWFGRAIKLDSTGSLVVPEGVSIVDWDMTKEQEQEQKQEREKAEKKKKRKVKRSVKKNTTSDGGEDVIGAIVALGSIITVAGIAWYLYTRGNKSH